jgi:cystathionine beta-lyase
MNFDKPIDRVNTHSAKWDMMEALYGVDPKQGTSMWVADMDFEPPVAVQDALKTMSDQGVYGYFGNDSDYRDAITGWMDRRHNWQVDPAHIFTTHGLVNGTALCVQSFTKTGDGVVLFTPVYHAFAKVIKASGRRVVECKLANNNGRYEMDFEAYDAQMDGSEKMVILCSPHNPGGRVWTVDELKQVAAFAERHDLILVSDEIHHDLTFGAKHTAMPLAAPEIADRLVMMTACTKTFNIAGCHTGNVIIADEKLRAKFAATINATGTSPNSFGLYMTQAAYAHGDDWVDVLVKYLDGNRKIVDATMAKIPGVKSMPMEATYLSWVNFEDTGLPKADYLNRVQKQALIAANHGETFGAGGETYLRFNFATQRAQLIGAMERLEAAFSDLQ